MYRDLFDDRRYISVAEVVLTAELEIGTNSPSFARVLIYSSAPHTIEVTATRVRIITLERSWALVNCVEKTSTEQ